MKIFLFVLVLIFYGNNIHAQTRGDSIPAYKSIPTVPPFKLMLVPDSTAFTKYDLKKKKATMIIVFSPDCDHCIHATEDLLAHYDLFKKVQIVMATSLSYPHIQKFYKDFKIADYPNIKVGLDNSYFLGTFYDVHGYPAVFLYNKKGTFTEFFDGSVKFEKVARRL